MWPKKKKKKKNLECASCLSTSNPCQQVINMTLNTTPWAIIGYTKLLIYLMVQSQLMYGSMTVNDELERI
jgi:hypothetical protein